MLGRTNPSSGRLALVLVDLLLKQLVAKGVIAEADIEALSAETCAQLEGEHSITSEGALMILNDSKLGQ
jgi:hypothetical protein